VTFIVVGIWHGPRWNFILLGLFQGIAINYEFFTKKFRLKLATALPEGIVKFGSSALVYIFFSFSLIFFNAAGASDAMHFIANMFVNIDLTGLNITFLARSDKIILLLGLTILFIIEYRQEQGKNIFDEIVYWPGWLRSGIYLLICILVIYFGSPMQEFIYMQF
jgi:D-alanyl-lipoteichoic acid acyltransferase DltB (MBOAT superfamily)